ncbi:MAG TPA: hypothetical protein VMB18_04195 [Terriglobales bacterium]|nr:hypothetical protein [Terriglobales bacterium]
MAVSVSSAARPIDLEIWKATNRAPFRGVLVLLDTASDVSPSGARGHRVLIPRHVAEAKINSLVGMGLSWDSRLDRHNPRQKVGVIDRANVVENRVEFGGYIFAGDFPEIISTLGESELGVSYESRDCAIKNRRTKVWEIIDCVFTGAAILKKEAAAYRSAWIRLDFSV